MPVTPSRRRDSLLAAAWFGGFGLAAAGAIFLAPAVRRGGEALLLYVALPAAAAAAAGSLTGRWVLDRGKTRGPWKAALIGLVTAVVACALYAPLFAVAVTLLDPDRPHSLVGLAAGVFLVGLAATGPVVLPAGLLAGWLLFLVRARRGGEQDDSGSSGGG